MAEAVGTDRWNHTAHILATLANCHRDPKRHPGPFKPADFHPFHKSAGKKQPKPKVPITALKAAFVDRRPLNAK